MPAPEIHSALLRFFADAALPGIVSVYLFGSEAEDRGHRESDVDVGVVLDRTTYPAERDRFELRLRLGSLVASALGGRAVDVVVLDDAPPGLGRHIVTSGRRIFCADPAADHTFVRDVQLRAADLEPFLRRMRRIKLQAIGRP